MSVVRALIQARMSSSRYPGKMLAPFRGQPLLRSVIDRVAAALPREHITVATSVEPSDDPLALYAGTLGVDVFRGPLDDVFGRFRLCLQQRPCEWFFRVCGDSPLLDSAMFGRWMAEVRDDLDIVTNVHLRTFPPGQSFELVRTAAFMGVDRQRLTPAQREHVTKFFYENAGEFRILNIEADESSDDGSICVDSIDDLKRLDALR